MKKDPKSIASSAIVSAETAAIITNGRNKGLPEEEIAFQALGGSQGIADLSLSISVMLTLRGMAAVVGIPIESINTSAIFTGYAYIVQHYPDHPSAVEFDKLMTPTVTVGDLWEYVLNKLDLPRTLAEKSPRYDHDWFFAVYNTKALEFNKRFGYSAEHAEEIALLLKDNG